jgi:serine phosphatase RsbU (regulator of sigma subunit)
MIKLVTLQGPERGREFTMHPTATQIGRQPDSTVYLESLAVSRHHALISCQDGQYFVEDQGSSNGTFINGQRVVGRMPLTDRDTLQIGPYLFALRQDATTPPPEETDPLIRSLVSVSTSNQGLYTQNPAYKLQVVLEIAQHLGRTLDLQPLLSKLLDQLFLLFPQADRGLVLLCEGDRLVVRAQLGRGQADPTTYPYSRSIVRRALEQGVGILSEDVRNDPSVEPTATLMALNLRSLICVPLISPDGRRLGAIQLDRSRSGMPFREEELNLLTAIGLQVSVVLDNAHLHAERLREERLRQELALARDIQQGFLPVDFAEWRKKGLELFARVQPARQVAGDLYDFFALDDGRLAFFVGDVSGKGMPAALFMVAVRTLCRHLATAGGTPAETLSKLNGALAADNTSGMFVTLAHGVCDPRSGELLLASGGHPMPLLRRADGTVEEVAVPKGRLLGVAGGKLGLADARLSLTHGETLAIYTDGFSEARDPKREMFDVPRLREALGGPRTALPLETCDQEVRADVERFAATAELQDDRTLLLLRRL